MDLNKVTIIGRVLRDPDQRRSVRGMPVVQFTVATLSAWRDPGSKERRESLDLHDVVAVGQLGKIVKQYVPKGTRAYIEGRLRTQSSRGKDGRPRVTGVIMLERLILLGRQPRNHRVPEAVDPLLRAEPKPDESETSDGEGAVQ